VAQTPLRRKVDISPIGRAMIKVASFNARRCREMSATCATG
jgi:hypothetical protein